MSIPTVTITTEFLRDFELLAAGDVKIVMTEALRGAREAQPDEMDFVIGQFEVHGPDGSARLEISRSRRTAGSLQWDLEGIESILGV